MQSYFNLFSFRTYFWTILFVYLIIYFTFSFFRSYLFSAAREACWKAYVPFYSSYILCKISMGKGWYFLFGGIPFLWISYPVVFVFLYFLVRLIIAYEVGTSFSQKLPIMLLYIFAPGLAECAMIKDCLQGKYCGAQNFEEQGDRILSFLRNLFGKLPTTGSIQNDSEREEAAEAQYQFTKDQYQLNEIGNINLPRENRDVEHRAQFCRYCGKRLPRQAIFCPECGKRND